MRIWKSSKSSMTKMPSALEEILWQLGLVRAVLRVWGKALAKEKPKVLDKARAKVNWQSKTKIMKMPMKMVRVGKKRLQKKTRSRKARDELAKTKANLEEALEKAKASLSNNGRASAEGWKGGGPYMTLLKQNPGACPTSHTQQLETPVSSTCEKELERQRSTKRTNAMSFHSPPQAKNLFSQRTPQHFHISACKTYKLKPFKNATKSWAGRLGIGASILGHATKGLWRNGSASDSRSEGWGLESLSPHFSPTGLMLLVLAKLLPDNLAKALSF